MYKYLPWFAVIFCLGVIFYLSHQPASVSNQLSTGVTQAILSVLDNLLPEGIEIHHRNLNSRIRKIAHFLIYFVCSMLLINALRRSKSGLEFRQHALITILFCVLFAVIDELHQLFILGRGAQVSDVIIDSTGACGGIIVYYLIGKWRKSHSSNE
ncbi:VanZ like family protein [Gracilibacillus ureilyticus]|uniref:VanZ like family protein n=1 Tax=Gracilibacillus ureilyticus TaxID=531814 RepID=A0A1H9R876_9BACI|nr:VanZ family protein [Gracilibacillus ureilyticus]SER68870.1 VanZ like family protein [Gracilibacillus ureilyticus]